MTTLLSKVASAFTVLALVATTMPTAVLAAPAVVAEEFVTVDGSYKGISVGFRTTDITDATAVTVTLTRASGSPIVKTANAGVLNLINANAGGSVQLTAPFVIEEGSFTEASDTTYWNPAPGSWDASTRPVSVTIEVATAGSGTFSVTNSTFNDGAPSWPTYESLLPPATSALVDSEVELAAALDDTNITTITLDGSFSVNATVEVDRAVTINGNDETITAASGVTGSAVLITGSGAVRISNLAVNGGGNAIQGIQAYVASDVELTSVTSMNNGKSGIMVNGSTVTVTDVTTSDNTWHGINVDQGSGVTSAAVLTVEGTSTHSESGPDIFVDDDAKGSVEGDVAQYALVKPTPTSSAYFLNSATVSDEAELTAALADTHVETITLDASFEVSATVQVNRSVTIDGNDETITAGGAISHVILITASDVTIKDLTVDGDDNMVHGIQAYVVTGITLENITSINNGKSGILVNGSTVTVTDVTTSGNGWHAINVDQGSGVTTVAALTISGTSSHGETVPAIWVDDSSKDVSVTDTNSQYTATAVVYLDGAVSITGIQYFLTPPPVVEDDDDDDDDGSGRSGSRRRTVNTNSNANDNASVTGQVNSVTPGQGQVLGASTYNFTVDLSYGSTGADVNALQQMLIDAGLLAIPAPTGWFGPMTRAALAQWQAAHGVAPAVGYFGPITRAAILAANAAATPTTTPASE